MSEKDQLGATLGGFEVLAELDSGGMGDVLIARKRAVGGFERLVALKTVRRELTGVGAAREMFLDEGRLLARLHHRGIAQVYDFGEDGDQLFLAMEFVAGVDFDELSERQVPPHIACLAMAEAARALDAAHRLLDHDGTPLGVVHRDVSPGNLMLTFDGSVKVLDFGIALMRGRRAPVTEFGMLKGKPPYMAPEQVRSESIDPRTDVFSASAVLWEMLTGERLFTGDSIFAIGHAIEKGDIAPPSQRRPEVPPPLDALVLRGLAKDPFDRFQSAAELASALEEVANAMGGESLASFSRRELAEEKRCHDLKIADIVNQTDARAGQSRVGRATNSHTVPAIALLDTNPDSSRSSGEPNARRSFKQLAAAHAPSPQPAPSERNLETDLSPRSVEHRGWLSVLLFLIVFAGVGAGVWFLLARTEATDAGQVGADAATLALEIADRDAQSVLAPTVVDAGVGDANQVGPVTPVNHINDNNKKPTDIKPSDRKRKRDAGSDDRPDGKKPDGKKPDGKKPDGKKPDGEKPDGTASSNTSTTIGKLTILSNPYSNVRLDGKFIGTSPRYLTVSVGPHTIVWTNPGTGSVRKRATVTVAEGEKTTAKFP